MDHAIIPRQNLQLRRVGKHYMMVEVCKENVNITHVFSLNETAAALWQRINSGAYTPEELAGWMCREYRVDKETAQRDVQQQLEAWREYGLIE
ncbi:PqqD family protein [Phocaeicola massiliensis]|jgi:hypothetical protein BACCOPRO_03211|uniref:PqqD family protein n=1 Tax=Phocaeicola massiliensis TaxID=204516 RepID=UPI00202E656B|nr:PqqD family protein [Phocaeicola massiliensis]MCM1614508.1 PqqD family protein [Phocaeicola massiliensis]MCM1706279.1 PqqD family protein [Phocaeicola massiliensis]